MTTTEPRLLLLVPTTTYRADDFMAAARHLNVTVNLAVTVASEQESVFRRTRPTDLLTLDFSDPDQAVETARAFARAHPIAAVIPVDDQTTVAAAAIAEALGLPSNSVEAARAARDKRRMRERFAQCGVPSPGFLALSLADDPEIVATRVQYPCVLKPVALSASQGVIRADGPSDFVAAWRRIRALLERPDVSCPEEARDVIVVEDFVPGPEVALEALLAGGELLALALFDKPDPLDGPFFEETIYVTPSRLSSATQRDVVQVAARAAKALGLHDGPIHAEVRLTGNGPVVIEVAGRSIGGLCARTLRFGTGMSLEELIIRHAMGMEIESYQREREPAGVMMIPIPVRGVLRRVEGIEVAQAVPGIEDIRIVLPPGAVLEPLPEGSKYLGFIFARADTPAAVEAALREAHGLLRFSIE